MPGPVGHRVVDDREDPADGSVGTLCTRREREMAVLVQLERQPGPVGGAAQCVGGFGSGAVLVVRDQELAQRVPELEHPPQLVGRRPRGAVELPLLQPALEIAGRGEPLDGVLEVDGVDKLLDHAELSRSGFRDVVAWGALWRHRQSHFTRVWGSVTSSRDNDGVRSPDQARLLVLGAGSDRVGLLEATRRAGVLSIAVDPDPAAPGFPLADRRALLSSEDEPAIHRLAEAEGIDGVVGGGADATVGIAARVAKRLGLPHPLEPPAASLACSRLKQRQRFVEQGIAHVPWRLATDDHPDVRVPCVVKPSDRGGHGLAVVRDRAELAPALRTAIEASRSGSALVEELVEGPEVIVHGFSVDGVFYELIAADSGGLGGLAAAAAASLGIENGPTQTEIRLAPDGPRVAELVASHEPELWRGAELDLNALVVRAALGKTVAADDLRFGTAHAPTRSAVEAAA